MLTFYQDFYYVPVLREAEMTPLLYYYLLLSMWIDPPFRRRSFSRKGGAFFPLNKSNFKFPLLHSLPLLANFVLRGGVVYVETKS